jgi:phospholipid/cholesterol/gamma-HCH transport system substrate-binding protein
MQLRRNEILTGVLVLATLAILTFILILLGAPGLFRPLANYKVYFDNAAGIKLGAPVLLAGRKIGQVDKLYSPVSEKEAERAVQAINAKAQPSPPPPPPGGPTPPPPPKRRFEVRIDVQVDKSAAVFKDATVRLLTLGLLGETAIDFSQGNESTGRAQDGDIFVGDRIPDFSEAVARMLHMIEPVATSATSALNQLQSTAQNLSRITDENSQMNMAIAQFRTFTENLTNLTARDSSLSLSLKNIEQISSQLTANDNIKVTLQNFRVASDELKSALNDLAPDLKTSGKNITDLTQTLRTQPWRLIIPSTKKYPEDEQKPPSTETITVRKSAKRSRNAEATPTPSGRGR